MNTNSFPIYQVDSFTDTPFTGNPAGVCLLSSMMEDTWMQKVAAEMNLSETAFLLPQVDGYLLRWFTPLVEVDLCGHATLASAHILWETDALDPSSTVRFHTRSGLLTCHRRANWIEMDFPSTPATTVAPPVGLDRALGAPIISVSASKFDYLVELDSDPLVRGINPDFSTLLHFPVRGVIVTSLSADPAYDFISRFFAPAVGINEDPVTGSAHSCLAPFWSNRLGKTELIAYQASARGGILRLRLAGERVIISGQAVTVISGDLVSS
jgi:PhzF family phenazine biosynthesis protein